MFIHVIPSYSLDSCQKCLLFRFPCRHVAKTEAITTITAKVRETYIMSLVIPLSVLCVIACMAKVGLRGKNWDEQSKSRFRAILLIKENDSPKREWLHYAMIGWIGNEWKLRNIVFIESLVWLTSFNCSLKAGLHDHLHVKFASHFVCDHRVTI